MLTAKASSDSFFGDGFEAAPSVGPSDAHRVLSKLAYGPRGGDVAAFEALPGSSAQKLAAWVDLQLDPALIDDSACEQRIASLGFTTLDKSRTQLYADHVLGTHTRNRPAAETECARLIRAVHSRRQLFERMVEFWHDHFNVLGWEYSIAPMFVQYDRDVIRSHAFGNFRALVEDVAKSNAMMLFLDNKSSRGASFNENYARELCELHTLGAENYYPGNNPNDVPRDAGGVPRGYCDNDVYELSRALTGWTLADGHWEMPTQNNGDFLYHDPWHDKAMKYFLGAFIPPYQPAMKDGRDAMDVLCAHAGTARHVCRKLIRRFVSDDVPPDLLESAATLWQQLWQAPDQIAQVLRHILGSNAVLEHWGGKRKRPYETLVQALRACDADVAPTPNPGWDPYGEMNSLLQQCGHGPFRWPTPDGYPDTAEKWQAVGVLAQSWKLVSNLTEWRAPGSGDRAFIARIHALTLQAFPSPGTRTANAIVDYWLQRAIGHAPAGPQRTALVDFLRQNAAPDEALDLVTDGVDGTSGLPTHAGVWRGNDLKRHYTIARLRATVALVFCLPGFYER